MKSRSGLTLIELLVVITIIALLVGLLTPALQSARESARLSHCASNMRQMGLAVLQFESANGTYPSGRVGFNSPSGWNGSTRSVSAHYQILPYMEEINLFKSADVANLHVMVSRFICPAVTTPKSNEPRTCYLFSAGDAKMTDNQEFSRRGFVVPGAAGKFLYHYGSSGTSATWGPDFNNAWYAPYFRRAADVKDGFSTSLMLAERAYGGSRPNTDLRSGYAIGTVNWHNVTTTLYNVCSGYVIGASYDSTIPLGGDIGGEWYDYLPGNSCFATVFPPNGPSCGGSKYGYWGGGPAATSFHAARGVNTVFCDGSVRFISDTINATCDSSSPHVGSYFFGNSNRQASPYGVWGALGSINGYETATQTE